LPPQRCIENRLSAKGRRIGAPAHSFCGKKKRRFSLIFCFSRCHFLFLAHIQELPQACPQTFISWDSFPAQQSFPPLCNSGLEWRELTLLAPEEGVCDEEDSIFCGTGSVGGAVWILTAPPAHGWAAQYHLLASSTLQLRVAGDCGMKVFSTTACFKQHALCETKYNTDQPPNPTGCVSQEGSDGCPTEAAETLSGSGSYVSDAKACDGMEARYNCAYGNGECTKGTPIAGSPFHCGSKTIGKVCG
jgi:hypothetical protein